MLKQYASYFVSYLLNNLENFDNIKKIVLYGSVSSTGIILYGYYQIDKLPDDVKHSIIIYWSKIGKNRGAFLNKIYGFNVHNKNYPGLLNEFNGRKLGKSCVLFPIQYKTEIFNLLSEYKVEANTLEVYN